MPKNKVTGEYPIEINENTYTLVFNWKALAQINDEHGIAALQDVGGIMNPETVAGILLAGLETKHAGELTKEDIIKASPPLVPTIQIIAEAIHFCYFGTEREETNQEQSKSKKK